MRIISILLVLVLAATNLLAQDTLIREGHRGCRGLMPENTVAAMKKALDVGTQVLELDVCISKDKKVIVSHDPYLSAAITLKPTGDSVTVKEQNGLVLYAMPYAEIKKFDVGSKHHAEFPQQQNFPAYIPLLSELIDSADAYARKKNLPLPRYNIEIKSKPETDDINHPKPQEMVDLVVDVCKSRNLFGRMNLQSFDVRPLQIIHRQYPDIVLSYLTANKKTVAENFNDLGFTPPLYSPYYKTVTADVVQFCHDKGVKIIPWTVNTKEEIAALVDLKVDGIITDYPNLFQ